MGEVANPWRAMATKKRKNERETERLERELHQLELQREVLIETHVKKMDNLRIRINRVKDQL